MHKNLHVLYIVILFCLLPLDISAQIGRDPIQQNSPVYQLAPLPVNIDPATIVLPDPEKGEVKQQSRFDITGQTKRISPKQEPAGNNVQRTGNPESTATIDKYGNQVINRVPTVLNEPAVKTGEVRLSPTPLPDPHNEITYPDLQVTATPETPQTQVFYGSERLPKTATEKTTVTDPAEKNNPQNDSKTSTVGKLSFLKQYAKELQSQIELNKQNANYPLAEKQQELLQLENLLKGE